MNANPTIAICGAGIAGVATAYYLLKERKDLQVILIDKNQPLSFTTSKSGENFRDYWPQKELRQFVSESILLMEELRELYGKDAFEMVYSGYHFVSHDINNPIFGTATQRNSEGYPEEITNPDIIQREHPYLDSKVEKVVKIKNAGKIDVYALGSLLLREAKKMGLIHVEGEIIGIQEKGSKFAVMLNSNQSVQADQVVIAAGPFINELAGMLGFQLPVTNTLQRKIIVPDPQRVIPKDMPFTIYADAQYLEWTSEEADFFAAEEKYHWLLNKFPGGLHLKPESGGIKMGWAFQTDDLEPSWEIPGFDLFPQVVLKGASRFIPALADYANNIPSPLIEYAGYYTRTAENWPLIGPTQRENVFVVGALAGYGTMSGCAAGKLCASHVLNAAKLPEYARFFHPLRYQDEAVVKYIDEVTIDGQL